jgi:hypothetical protein
VEAAESESDSYPSTESEASRSASMDSGESAWSALGGDGSPLLTDFGGGGMRLRGDGRGEDSFNRHQSGGGEGRGGRKASQAHTDARQSRMTRTNCLVGSDKTVLGWTGQEKKVNSQYSAQAKLDRGGTVRGGFNPGPRQDQRNQNGRMAWRKVEPAPGHRLPMCAPSSPLAGKVQLVVQLAADPG